MRVSQAPKTCSGVSKLQKLQAAARKQRFCGSSLRVTKLDRGKSDKSCIFNISHSKDECFFSRKERAKLKGGDADADMSGRLL